MEQLYLAPYKPFKVGESRSVVFDVEVVEDIDVEILEPLIVDAELSSEGMTQVDVYRVDDGFLYKIILPVSRKLGATLLVDRGKRRSLIKLEGDASSRTMALNNALILSYISFTMEHSTLLLHASAVIYEGAAYLFLGKSGTGKSTHSRMWLERFYGSELLNDDHPVVRAFDDGTITVYGSPWSGKTPCYRNLSQPLGAIVRIERAPKNELETLRPLKAFASLTTSCSGAQWSRRLMNNKVKAIERIITTSAGYCLRCLPNNEAAEVCYYGIKAE